MRRSVRRFAEVLGLDDPVIDVAITPNRATALGVRGIARDLAAAGLGTLKPATGQAGRRHVRQSRSDGGSISADAAKRLPGRSPAAMIRGVKNGPCPHGCRTG